eukprot:721927-Rhodomonas_salina.1
MASTVASFDLQQSGQLLKRSTEGDSLARSASGTAKAQCSSHLAFVMPCFSFYRTRLGPGNMRCGVLAGLTVGSFRVQFRGAAGSFEFLEGWETGWIAPSGGAVATTGAGFSSDDTYICLFVGLYVDDELQERTSPAVYVSPQQLSCLLPDWGSTYSSAQTVLQIRHDGVLVPKETTGVSLISFEPFWRSLSVSAGDAGGGSVLVLSASGLVMDAASTYKCIFTALDGGVVMESALSSALSPSQLACTTPTWGQLNAAQTTTIALKNELTGALVAFKGSAGADAFEFTTSW